MGYRQVSYPEQVWYILRYFLMEGGKKQDAEETQATMFLSRLSRAYGR